jgi:hypothetical protein
MFLWNMYVLYFVIRTLLTITGGAIHIISRGHEDFHLRRSTLPEGRRNDTMIFHSGSGVLLLPNFMTLPGGVYSEMFC